MYPTMLVVGDSHVQQGQDLSRFDALGKLIVSRKPDIIVLMGDFLDMEAFNSHEPNNLLGREGKRHIAELDAGAEAIRRMLGPLRRRADRAKTNKKRPYSPRMIWLDGNHEERTARFERAFPHLIGALVDYKKHLGVDSWECVPYRRYLDVHGILLTHAPMNERNQPVTGKYAAYHAVDKCQKTVVFGHVHSLMVVPSGRFDEGGERNSYGISCGCFFEHTDGYADGGLNKYWRGVVLLELLGDGEFMLETISLGALMRKYGDAKQIKAKG